MPILLQPEAPSEIDYPSSDGKPMAETGFHLNTMLWLRLALEDLRDSRHDDSYIATDMFWYWEEGNPKACVAPDMMIIPGMGSTNATPSLHGEKKVAFQRSCSKSLQKALGG